MRETIEADLQSGLLKWKWWNNAILITINRRSGGTRRGWAGQRHDAMLVGENNV